jgi:hypothetical protein
MGFRSGGEFRGRGGREAFTRREEQLASFRALASGPQVPAKRFKRGHRTGWNPLLY